MALSQDQKKHLLIGGGVGAIAVFLGSMILGGRKASAGPLLPGGGVARGEPHHEARKKRREDGREGGRENGRENGRGEYGRKKKHHHKEHGHGG
jgi:hypothetical protein